MADNDSIRYAERDGVYLIKFEGDIRVTLCPSFDELITGMFSDPGLTSILLDLSTTSHIDSTALGLIAKIAARSQSQLNIRPVVIGAHPDIRRTLECMGLLPVLDLLESIDDLTAHINEQLQELPLCQHSSQEVCEKVLDAHQHLSELNDTNREAFRELIANLEDEHKRYSRKD